MKSKRDLLATLVFDKLKKNPEAVKAWFSETKAFELEPQSHGLSVSFLIKEQASTCRHYE